MKKLIGTFCALLLLVGCSSSPEKKERDLMEGAAICNKMCKQNPELGELSFKTGGGVPLLFMGSVGVKCACRNPN